MYLGLPIISYDVEYNRETTENTAVYFRDSDDLLELVSNMSENELKRLGKKMEEIAKRRYTWQIISEKYAALF